MKAFLDTSVLVATFYGEHEHHEPSFDLFSRQKKATACTAAYCLAEVYSVVTGMPGQKRASPDEALLFLSEVRERLDLITLNEVEYLKVLEHAATAGIAGGTAYDAIVAHRRQTRRRHAHGTSNTSTASARTSPLGFENPKTRRYR